MVRSRRVAWATHPALPGGNPDDLPAIAALNSRGVRVTVTVWDDPSVDWSRYDAVVLRSTWDYHRRRAEFLEWVDRTGATTEVWNPPELVRWNSHKEYLLDLARQGSEIVPTELLRRGSRRTLASVLAARAWTTAVVKPAVGADSFALRFVGPHRSPDDERHLRELLTHGDALVQPLLAGVRAAGERSLVFFGGNFSHAVALPFVRGGGPREGRRTRVDDRTLQDAERVVGHLSRPPLYARVDLLPSARNRWVLSELELIEPFLYFRADPPSAGRFARALVERLDRGE